MLLQRSEERDGAFLSRIFTRDETKVFHYTPENKDESVTQRYPHTSVKEKFKTVQSPGKMMDTVFWDIHGVILVDFTPPGSTVIAIMYEETLKGYSAQETRIVDQRSSSFALQCSTSQCCCNRESIEHLGAWTFFHDHHTDLIWHHRTTISSQR
jgi:hypothetical protein